MNAVSFYTADNLIEMIARLVCESSGQDYNEKIRGKVEARVKRRVVELGLSTFADYVVYFQGHEKVEFKQLLAMLTTQSSRFFSEFSHFEYISNFVLKPLVPHIRKRADKTLHVWSAACAKGQEVYSLAMYLRQALTLYGTDLQVKVMGTDSDLEAIKTAKVGMYPRGEMRDVPLQFLGNEWEKVTVSGVDMMRVKPGLKQLVHFEYANLLALKAKFPNQKFDLIFARNVFSYFNESEIKESCLELISHLGSDGHLMVGLSESLQGLNLPLECRGPSVYAVPVASETKVEEKVETSTEAPVEKELIKIFCIDDSPAVHTLMRSILKKDNGFVIIGNAMSMTDVARQNSTLRDADLVTVNLQSGEENNLHYLSRNLQENHPPALVITSEAKEHAKLIEEANKLGEFEFVEKPVLNHLSEQGEIIRAKLKTLYLNRQNNVLVFRGQDQFKKSREIKEPDHKVRVVVGGMSHLRKISSYLRELKGKQPPTYLFFEGMNTNLITIASELKRLSGKNCIFTKDFSEPAKVGEIRVYDFRNFFARVQGAHGGHLTSIAVFGEISASSSELILNWDHAKIILEDLGRGEAAAGLKSQVQDIFPASSFAFLSSEHLSPEKT